MLLSFGMNIVYLIYFTAIAIGFLFREFLFLSIILIVLIPFVLFGYKLFVKNSNIKFEKLMQEAKADFQSGKEIKPFINPNTARWEVLSLIPGVSTLNAKRFVNQRNIKGIKAHNPNELFELLELGEFDKGFAERVVKF